MIACMYQHQECLDLLLRQELELVDNEGNTLLHYAAAAGFATHIPKMLLSLGAYKNSRGETAFFWVFRAFQLHHYQVQEMNQLIDIFLQAQPNAPTRLKSNDGTTLFMAAAQYGCRQGLERFARQCKN